MVRHIGSLDRLQVSHIHTRYKTGVGYLQPDLLEQIDCCPYIGSSIGEKLETGLIQQSRKRGRLFGIGECDVRNDGRPGAYTHTNMHTHTQK